MRNFFELLLKKKRINLLPEILIHLELAVDRSKGVLKAYVKSAVLLDEKAKKEMERKLSLLFKMNTVIETSVDPELLAGVVIQAGDTRIDNSLKAQLKNLKSRLHNGY